MSPITPFGDSARALSAWALDWPSLQRVLERWLRRWAWAIMAWLVGVVGLGLAQWQVGEDHARAWQAVTQLQQQWAAVPAVLAQSPDKDPSQGQQELLMRLPMKAQAQAQSNTLWLDLQQALTEGGLQLLSLRPLLAKGANDRAAVLPSQTVALRLRGRFEDWSRVWAALTQAGPLCSIDQIQVTPTEHPEEVHIDVVLRVWLRPVDEVAPALVQPEGAWHTLAMLPPGPGARPGASLFAQARSGPLPRGAGLVDPAAGSGPGGLAGATVAAPTAEPWSDDPLRWPVSRVRWVGIWQQGHERQAILSAGPHGVRVSLGQRVTQEGHRVVAITDAGVRLRATHGAVLTLGAGQGSEPSQEGRAR